MVMRGLHSARLAAFLLNVKSSSRVLHTVPRQLTEIIQAFRCIGNRHRNGGADH
jgi:hypothetical protein